MSNNIMSNNTGIMCDFCEDLNAINRNNDHMRNMDLCDQCYSDHMDYINNGYKFFDSKIIQIR